MARLVTQPDVVEFVEYVLLQRNKSVSLTEVSCSRMAEAYEGKTISDLRMGNITGATIVGLKNFEGKYVFNPGPGHMLNRGDKLFVLGSHGQVIKLQEFLEQEPDWL
jgi:voltage-gated potassium channel